MVNGKCYALLLISEIAGKSLGMKTMDGTCSRVNLN